MNESTSVPSRPNSEALQKMCRSLRWSRLAEPQADLYDSLAVLALVGSTTTPERPAPYVRRTPFGALRVAHVFMDDELPPNIRRGYSDAETNHPCIEEAAEILQSWPVGLDQVRLLIESLHPAIDRRNPAVVRKDCILSSSHSVEGRFGALWATVNSAVGLAQSIVHEIAHHKLCALGVSFEHARAVVANGSASRYPSPLVAWKRPMTAVLHAHYALLHITALDCALLAKERSRAMRAALSRSFARHSTLMAQSAVVIRRHMIVDPFGVSFMRAMWDWMGRVQGAGRYCIQ